MHSFFLTVLLAPGTGVAGGKTGPGGGQQQVRVDLVRRRRSGGSQYHGWARADPQDPLLQGGRRGRRETQEDTRRGAGQR